MISRDTDTAGATSANLRKTRAGLYLTTAIVGAAAMMPANAAVTSVVVSPLQTITVTGITETPGTINAVTTVPTETNVTVIIDTAAEVSTAGTISAGYFGVPTDGDGAIIFTNNGKLGVVTAGVPTTVVGVSLIGSQSIAGFTGTTPLAANALTFTNSNLITGGVDTASGAFSNLFNSIDFTNAAAGTIYGNVTLMSAGGNIKVASAGTILNGGGGNTVNINAGSSIAHTDAVNNRTATYTNGNVEAVFDGNLGVLTAGVITGRGDINVNQSVTVHSATVLGATSQPFSRSGGGNATVTVNGIAGNVKVAAGDKASKAEGFIAAPGAAGANATGYVTSKLNVYAGTGKSTVTIGATGDVSSVVSSAGTGGSTVKISGKVGAGGVTSTSSVQNTTALTTINTNGTPATILTTVATTNKFVGGAASATVDAGASVAGGGVASKSDTAASTVINGSVKGDVSADAQSGLNTDLSTATSAIVNPATLATKDLQSYNDSTAEVIIGATGTLGSTTTGSDVTVKAYKTATLTNSGKIFAAGGKGAVSILAGDSATVVTSNVINNSVTSLTVYNKSLKSTTVTNSGGTAAYTNNLGGYVGGTVTLNGPLGVTIVNNGQTGGATTANSEQSTVTDVKDEVGTVATSGTVTTTTATLAQVTTTAATGGSVEGTYAGTNGEINLPPINTVGTVSQTANKASKVTVSGTIYGDVNSEAGTGTNSTVTTNTSSITVDDVAVLPSSGSVTVNNTKATATSSTAGGDSTVTVSGKVVNGTPGVVIFAGTGNVVSKGKDSSTVTISGSTSGDAKSTATGAFTQTTKLLADNLSYSQTNTKGVFVTTANANSSSDVMVRTGGAAVTNVTGTGTVGGAALASGLASASSTVEAGAKVGNSLTVETSGTDFNNSTTNTYTYDATGKVGTLVTVVNNTSGPSAAVGNATATVAGIVGNNTSGLSSNGLGGDVTVTSNRGDATATINGRVRAGTVGGAFAGNVNATTNGSTVNTTSSNTFRTLPTPDFLGDALTSPTGHGTVLQTAGTTTTTTTATGGKATILVDTSATFKAQGVGNPANNALGIGNFNSVEGSATANGLQGATITVTAGSSIGGSAQAASGSSPLAVGVARNIVNKTDVTPGAKASSVQVVTTTNVGKAAAIVNDGVIGNAANAYGTTTATVTNSATGRIGGSVVAGALQLDSVATTTNNDINNLDPSTATQVTTTVFKAVGGVATVTNAGTIIGSVTAWGGTGTVTNTGNIVGGIVVGSTSGDRTEVTTTTNANTVGPVRTANAPLFKQTYTVNQSGIVGNGIAVTGATEFPPTNLKTSDITAVINLNPGSVTVGNITGQQSGALPGQQGAGAFLTATTLNLNATGNTATTAGFLGLDFYSNPTSPNPAATAPSVPTFPLGNPEANFTNAQAAAVRACH